MRPQLLIINPNTSASVSQILQDMAARELCQQCLVRVQTARLGASYISDEVSFAIAGHALLDAYAKDKAEPHQRTPDAVLIGCFGDPGLLALRQLCDAPVIGLAQGSMQMAHARGRYAVITGGHAWVPMLHRLVAQLGLDDRLSSIQAVDKTGAQLAADPQAAAQELADLCEQVLAEDPTLQTILLGGAALGGLAQPIEALLHARGIGQVSIMDSVASCLRFAAEQASAFAAQRPSTSGIVRSSNPVSGMACLNVSPELQALLKP